MGEGGALCNAGVEKTRVMYSELHLGQTITVFSWKTWWYKCLNQNK